jgi:predicted O-methyltransferase YrrM
MSEPLWTDVDANLERWLLPDDPHLAAALQASEAAGLPAIAVSPTQGKLLHLLVRMHGAKRVVEVGTLGGYSTIWLARALPADGRLVSFELDTKHADVARANLARAGLDHAEVRTGAALELFPALREEAPFDFFFIDADKASNVAYFDWALQLSRPGSVIVVDNVVRGGRVVDAESRDAAIVGTRALHAHVGKEPRVTATAVQTVGSKGHDGFLLALVTG